MAYEYEIIKDYNNKCKLIEIGDAICECFDIYDLSLYLAKEKNMRWLNNEKSYIVAYNINMELIGIYLESSGNSNSCQTCLKEILTFLLLTGAEKYIMIHNHPNDNLKFSDNDLNSGILIQKYTDELGIVLEDNIIIGNSGFLSMNKNKIIEWVEEDFIPEGK